jgi:hypothetical protein
MTPDLILALDNVLELIVPVCSEARACQTDILLAHLHFNF